MTKKDHDRLALFFKDQRSHLGSVQFAKLVYRFMTELKKDNRRFDRVRFIRVAYDIPKFGS